MTVQLPSPLKLTLGLSEKDTYPLAELKKVIDDARLADFSTFDPEEYFLGNWSLSTGERNAKKIETARAVDSNFGRLVEYLLAYQHNYEWIEFRVLSDVVDTLEEDLEAQFIKCEESHMNNCTVGDERGNIRRLSFAADLNHLIYDHINVISAEDFTKLYELANDIYAHSEVLRDVMSEKTVIFLDAYREAHLLLEDEVESIIYGEHAQNESN